MSSRPTTFERYGSQYETWREVARSLPRPIDVHAARDALRDEATEREATSADRSLEERGAEV